MEDRVVWLPVDLLKPHPVSLMIYRERDDSELLESVRMHGIRQPLIVTSGYVIISGCRRWRVARKLGLEKVPCIVRDFDNEVIAVIEYNMYRVKTPREIYLEAKFLKQELRRITLQKQLSRLKQYRGDNRHRFVKFDETAIDSRSIIAKKLNISAGTLHMLETIYENENVDPETVKRLDEGLISINRAYQQIKSKLIPKVEIPRIFLGRFFSGKSRIVMHLISLMPRHEVYIEVFGGYASFLLNKPPVEVELYNDISRDLTNLMMCLKDYPYELMTELMLMPYSRDYYIQLMRELKNSNANPPDIERAAKFWLLNELTISGLSDNLNNLSTSYALSIKQNKAKNLRNKIRRLIFASSRLLNVQITNLDFRRVIERYDDPDVFMYLDPPYYETDDALGRHFTEEDHLQLKELLDNTQGKWMLTYNNHKRIRKLYEKYHILEITVPSVAPVSKTMKRQYYTHLIITNYNPQKEALFYTAAKHQHTP